MRHPVVGVGVPGAAVQGGGTDREAVVVLVDVAAEAGELGGERGEPVGLVAADVGDPAQVRRSVGQRAQRGHRRRQLAVVVQVEVDALEPRRRARGR